MYLLIRSNICNWILWYWCTYTTPCYLQARPLVAMLFLSDDDDGGGGGHLQ